jgi:hypothetical protein
LYMMCYLRYIYAFKRVDFLKYIVKEKSANF